MFEWVANPEVWIALLTLTTLEIVLGIDNIVFISILAGKLPEAQQAKTRNIGLIGALVMRLALLGALSWMMGLTKPLFSLLEHNFSGRDLILLGGGLFLIGKATHEIHTKLEGEEGKTSRRTPPSMTATIIQIMLLDMVFSLDSVITAIGMTNMLGVMVAAIVIAIIVMMLSAGAISDFVNRHPTVRMLALSFLLLIGVMLVADGAGHHIPKGYIYFAMGFSVLVELLNMRMRAVEKEEHPVELRQAVR